MFYLLLQLAYEVIWPEDLSKRGTTDRIHRTWLEVDKYVPRAVLVDLDQYGSWNVLVCRGFIVIDLGETGHIFIFPTMHSSFLRIYVDTSILSSWRSESPL